MECLGHKPDGWNRDFPGEIGDSVGRYRLGDRTALKEWREAVWGAQLGAS